MNNSHKQARSFICPTERNHAECQHEMLTYKTHVHVHVSMTANMTHTHRQVQH